LACDAVLVREPKGQLAPGRQPGGYFRAADLDEIKRWNLSRGPEAQVLEPSRLKQMVHADLQKSLGQYTAHRIIYALMKKPRA